MNANDFNPRYEELHRRLETLKSAPVPDMVAIERVMGELEAVLRQAKAAEGRHGNNPAE